jgi:hypothetical protein
MKLYWLNTVLTGRTLLYLLVGLVIFALIALLVGLSGNGG